MFRLLIDILKAMTVDAWDGFKYRRYVRKSIRKADEMVDKYGIIGAFLKQFEEVLGSGITDENARYLLDDFVNVVIPLVKENHRVEMDEDWETLCSYCAKYEVVWDV